MNLNNDLLSRNKNTEILSAYIASDRIKSNINENSGNAKKTGSKD